MENLRKTGLVIGLVGCLLAGPQLAFGAMHATKEFEDGATRPVSIAVLPVHAEVLKQKIVENENQIEESAELAAHLTNAMITEFEERGYLVRVLSPQEINSDPELQELVVDADRRYGELLTQVQTKLKRQVAKRRYNAGEEMQFLAAKLGVDAIAFTRMQIVAAAPGRAALAWTVGIGSAGSTSMMSISVIDGQTADIEAYFVPPVLRRGSAFSGYNDIMEDPVGEMAKMARITLDDLPAADPSARVRESDDDVLADLESLLEE